MAPVSAKPDTKEVNVLNATLATQETIVTFVKMDTIKHPLANASKEHVKLGVLKDRSPMVYVPVNLHTLVSLVTIVPKVLEEQTVISAGLDIKETIVTFVMKVSTSTMINAILENVM